LAACLLQKTHEFALEIRMKIYFRFVENQRFAILRAEGVI